MKKITGAIFVGCLLVCIPTSLTFGFGGIQIGLEIPVLFLNEYNEVTYKGAKTPLSQDTRTEGGSVLLGYHYLFLNADSIEQKFVLDTTQNEKIKVKYQSANIGLIFKYPILSYAIGFGYGQAYMECVSGCTDYYKNPEKEPVITGLFHFGITYFNNSIFTISTRYYSTSDFKNYATANKDDVMRLKNTSLAVIMIGFIWDF